jgi:hypothetical protein
MNDVDLILNKIDIISVKKIEFLIFLCCHYYY